MPKINETPDEATERKLDEVSIPVRMLHAVGVAAKENSRYSIDGVLIEVDHTTGILSVAATDGRRLIVAQVDRQLFDDDLRILINGGVARNAVKLACDAINPGETEPMALVRRKDDICSLEVRT